MSRRDEVLAAALDLLDEVGLAALTVRRLADRLGVAPAALYRHYTSKGALLGAMVEHLIAADGGARTTAPGIAWDDRLRAAAHGLRRAVLTHRDGALLVITHLEPGPAAERYWLDTVASVAAAGLDHETATAVTDTVFAFTNGFTMEEQARDGFPPPPDRRVWRDAGFHLGLELILDGARARMAVTRGTGSSPPPSGPRT